MELGSEYNLSLNSLSVVKDNIFDYLSDFEYCYYFDSGRSALRHLVNQLRDCSHVLLPEFICESVTNCFDGRKVSFYKLNKDFSIDLDDLRAKIQGRNTIIFIMHYFGVLQNPAILSEVRSLADKNGVIIFEDTTHSIFTKSQTIGDYMICSIRKWLPVPGGGALYYRQDKGNILVPDYPKSADNSRSYGMILKDLFLNTGHDCNLEYRSIFSDSEQRLDNQKEIYEISDFARYVASCMDIEQLTRVRKKNYDLLNNYLMKSGIKPVIELEEHDIPLVYPIRVKNRNKLRSYLMDKKIYCAVHWPFDNQQPRNRPFAIRNADELISLPIDQRYDEEHIKYLIDVLSKYGGDLLF